MNDLQGSSSTVSHSVSLWARGCCSAPAVRRVNSSWSDSRFIHSNYYTSGARINGRSMRAASDTFKCSSQTYCTISALPTAGRGRGTDHGRAGHIHKWPLTGHYYYLSDFQAATKQQNVVAQVYSTPPAPPLWFKDWFFHIYISVYLRWLNK